MKVLSMGAVWCAECLGMKPVLKEIEKEIPELQIEYLEYDDNEELMKKFGITDIPVFIFVDKNNKELFRLEGLQNKEELIKTIKENLDK